ncbi:unnamed protein product, partial [Sphacelaria rigidula]
VEKNVNEQRVTALGIRRWNTRDAGSGIFEWVYDTTTTCFLVEGRAVVTPNGGEPELVEAGDLITCGKGLKCTWWIQSPVIKHYMTHG